MYERLTDRARKAMIHAQRHAIRSKRDRMGTQNAPVGLIEIGNGYAHEALRRIGVILPHIEVEIQRIQSPASEEALLTIGKLKETENLKQVLELAAEIAREMNHNYIGTEHILLAILRVPESTAAKVLAAGNDLEIIRSSVMSVLQEQQLATT